MMPGSEGPTTAGRAQDSSDDTIELELTAAQRRAVQDLGDDTIELELTGEQTRALSQAVAAELPTAPPEQSGPMSFGPEYENFASRRAARIDFICNVTCAAAVLGIAALFLWPASDPHPPAPAAIITEPVRVIPQYAAQPRPVTPFETTIEAPAPAASPVAPAEPQGAPVRIRNAFDATEMFEFPRGTTGSEAREAVAELLLSRARDRLAAGNFRPNRGAAAQQPEASVTKLVAREKEPLNGTN